VICAVLSKELKFAEGCNKDTAEGLHVRGETNHIEEDAYKES